MSDVANLKIVATADINNLTQGLSKSRAEIAKTSLEANKLDKSLGGNLTKGSNSATIALTNLGRVAQDAPFGFIGIANNLNPLLESFQRLKVESGSTGGALKALTGSLMGAGGFGLALSAVTAIVSFASIGFTSWTRGLKGGQEALDANAKSAKAAADSYQSIVASVAQEVSSVAILVESFKKENLSRKEKQNIIEELQKISPAYFSNLNKENTTVNQLTAAYDAYARSIVRTIELKVREKQLNDVIARRLELQDKSVKLTNIEVDANGKVRKSINAIYDAEKTGIGGQFTDLLLTKKEREELNNLLKTEAQLLIGISNLKQPQDYLKLERAGIKKTVEDYGELKKVLLELDQIRFYEKGRFDEFLKNVKPDSKVFNKVTVPIRAEIILPPLTNTEKTTFFLRGEELSKSLVEGLRAGLEELVEGIGVSFGELLGNAMTGSVDIGDFFSGLFNQIGKGLKQLGAYFIKTAIQIKFFKEFATKNPYLALAAGIALVALGTAINNATAKKQAFATGGLVGGTGNRDTISALLTPGEFVLTKSAVARIGVANLESMNRGIVPAASSLQGISGGGGSMQVEVTGNISGDTIWLANSRASQRRGRQA